MTTPLYPYKYNCKLCDYNTNRLSQINKHFTTRKHIMTTHGLPTCNNDYNCICGKEFSCRQNLYRHKKTCSVQSNSEETEHLTNSISQLTPNSQIQDVSVMFELLKQNQDFKELIIEQTKQLFEQNKQNAELQQNLLEAVKDGKFANNTINNNTNNNCNNKFNLNVFLNETCKDAITLDDFIKTFHVTRDDFIHTGNVGFIEGISTVMLNRFRDMDMHTRPLHCTDLKRETVYIKNADKWEKEDNNKTNLRKAVKGVANQNMKELWRWYNDSKPEVEQIGSDECENYFKYYKAALGGCGKEEDLKFEDKIIKNVLKEVQIDKSTMTIQ